MALIDWMTCVNNLRHDYKSVHTIALEIDSNAQHLNRIAMGEVNEPRFNTALKLLDLHIKHCGIEKHRKLIK